MAAATISVGIARGYTTSFGGRGASVASVHVISPSGAGTYPAGGWALGRQSFGFRGFDFGAGCISDGGTLRAVIQVKRGHPATANLRLFVNSTGAEVANGAAVVDDYFRIFVLGG